MDSIKQTSEVFAFAQILCVAIAKEISTDGLQISDAIKLFENKEFRQSMQKAVEGIHEVPRELGDIGIIDSFMIGRQALDLAQAISEVFKK